MKIFSPPYRWSKRPIANLRSCLWDVTHGVKNLWRWRDVVWNDYDFDWEPMARMMIFKLKRMEPVLRNGSAFDGERRAREVAICRTLLERVVADNYLQDAMRWADLPLPTLRGGERALTEAESRRFSSAVKKAEERAKADLDLFGKMFSRHLRSWWD